MVCLIATMALMSSCQKQEDLIVGTWKLEELTCTPDNPMMSSFMKDLTFTFNADNTCTMALTIFGETDTDNGTYTISNDKLTITIDGEPAVCDVLELNKKNLEFVVEETDEDGTISLDMKFKRQ